MNRNFSFPYVEILRIYLYAFLRSEIYKYIKETIPQRSGVVQIYGFTVVSSYGFKGIRIQANLYAKIYGQSYLQQLKIKTRLSQNRIAKVKSIGLKLRNKESPVLVLVYFNYRTKSRRFLSCNLQIISKPISVCYFEIASFPCLSCSIHKPSSFFVVT